MNIAIVVIGRNEAPRLRQSLAAALPQGWPVVYVDSGSRDASVAIAQSMGVAVVELDASTPFSAARARNTGFARALEISPVTEAVMFVDGDTEMARGWVDSGCRALVTLPHAGAVFGRLREKHPEASVYNRLCELEWDLRGPVGEVAASGGNVLVRADAFAAIGGFDPAVLAGEDDEMCLRLRRAGWNVYRIEAEMGLHDAALLRLSQWWARAVRSGYAYTQGAAMHGRGPERHFVRDLGRIAVWGLFLPVLILTAAWPTGGWSLLALSLYVLQGLRIHAWGRRRGTPAGLALAYAISCVAIKLPQVLGVLRWVCWRARGRQARLIEHKRSPELSPRGLPRAAGFGLAAGSAVPSKAER